MASQVEAQRLVNGTRVPDIFAGPYLENKALCRGKDGRLNDAFLTYWIALLIGCVLLIISFALLLRIVNKFLATKEGKEAKKVFNFKASYTNILQVPFFPLAIIPYYRFSMSYVVYSLFLLAIFTIILGLLELVEWYAAIFIVLMSACYTVYKVNGEKLIVKDGKNDRAMKDYWSPANVYQDFTMPMMHVIFLFIIQLLLCLFYIFSVIVMDIPCFDYWQPFTLYMLAAVLKSLFHIVEITYTTRDYVEESKFWMTMKCSKHEDLEKYYVSWYLQNPSTYKSKRKITKKEVAVRYYMDTFINRFLYWMVNFFMVIEAANGNSQNFVLVFIEARFILTLDDNTTWNYKTKFNLEKQGENYSDEEWA